MQAQNRADGTQHRPEVPSTTSEGIKSADGEMIYYLPKGYLSWSQMSLWEESPQRYIDQYIDGKERFVTKEMRTGQLFSVMAQKGITKDPQVNDILERLPKRELAECELMTEYKGVPLFIVFDSADERGFEEYKTGKTEWTEERVRNHGQMLFYSLGFYLATKKIPQSTLHWLPTVQEENNILLTGEIKSFPIRFRKAVLMKFGTRILRVAKEITNYEQYRKKVIKL